MSIHRSAIACLSSVAFLFSGRLRTLLVPAAMLALTLPVAAAPKSANGAESLLPGVYELHYLVRSVTPGAFAWPGAHDYLQDAPEEFGRSAGTTLNVTE